eukprot:743245-Alexandrium_andersonii.AAC.1
MFSFGGQTPSSGDSGDRARCASRSPRPGNASVPHTPERSNGGSIATSLFGSPAGPSVGENHPRERREAPRNGPQDRANLAGPLPSDGPQSEDETVNLQFPGVAPASG